MSPILVVGALLGQMKLPKPLAERAASLFGLTEGEKRMLNEVPTRGVAMPPTDPLIYRLYELVMVNGPALKALIEEEFGDGIMSAIDFDLEFDRLAQSERRPGAARDERQIPAVQILRRRAGRAGVRVQGRVIEGRRLAFSEFHQADGCGHRLVLPKSQPPSSVQASRDAGGPSARQ